LVPGIQGALIDRQRPGVGIQSPLVRADILNALYGADQLLFLVVKMLALAASGLIIVRLGLAKRFLPESMAVCAILLVDGLASGRKRSIDMLRRHGGRGRSLQIIGRAQHAWSVQRRWVGPGAKSGGEVPLIYGQVVAIP